MHSQGHHPLYRWRPVCDVTAATFDCKRHVSLLGRPCGTLPCHTCLWHWSCVCPHRSTGPERKYGGHLPQDLLRSICSIGCKFAGRRHSRRYDRVSSLTCEKLLRRENGHWCKSGGNCCKCHFQEQVPQRCGTKYRHLVEVQVKKLALSYTLISMHLYRMYVCQCAFARV